MRGWSLQLDAKGAAGMLILALVLACALLAPWIAPHDPNRQDLLNTVAPPAWTASGSATHPLSPTGSARTSSAGSSTARACRF